MVNTVSRLDPSETTAKYINLKCKLMGIQFPCASRVSSRIRRVIDGYGLTVYPIGASPNGLSKLTPVANPTEHER